MVEPLVFQIAGFQNSGKTTVAQKLLQAGSRLGWKIVTIKHHGHGGKPEVVEEKDSSRHLSFGAFASLVEGDGRWVLQAENIECNLEDQIQIMSYFQPDVILVEGYKHETFPKLLLLRGIEDFSLLDAVTNVFAIGCKKEELLDSLRDRVNIPCFRTDEEGLTQFIVDYLKKFVHKIDEKTS